MPETNSAKRRRPAVRRAQRSTRIFARVARTMAAAAREDSLGPAVPPVPPPPGHTVTLAGRGDLFYRDSGGDGPLVLLVHGWLISADVNWIHLYQPLADAGFRVVALDHRGHGRGLRTNEPFRLADCADDAAALLRHLDAGPALVAGYSMGGPISELLARRHPELVSALVLAGTTPSWDDPGMRRSWRRMWVLALTVGIFPHGFWRFGTAFLGMPRGPETAWMVAELTRSDALAIAEAGREMGRYDARPWLGDLPQPVAVVVTTKDRAVPRRRQYELAELTQAKVFEAHCDHLGPGSAPHLFEPAFSAAVQHIAAQAQLAASASSN